MAKRQPYGLTLAVLLVGAMAYALSQTMVVPALPEIQRQLDTTSTAVTFVLTGYLLTAAVATPIMGPARRHVRKEPVARRRVERVRARIARLRRLAVDRGADRRPRYPGSRRSRVPALVRNHPRRVPARAGVDRDRADQRDVRNRGRGGARAQRGDRRSPRLRVDLLARADRRLRCDRRRAPVHPRVTGEEPGSDRLDRSRPAVGGPRCATGRRQRGKFVGLGVGRGGLAVRSLGRRADRVGRLRVPGSRAARRHADDARPRRADDKPHRAPGRVRDVRLLHPDTAVRPDPHVGRVRVRSVGDRGRALHAPLRGHDARRRPARGVARRAHRLEAPASARDRDRRRRVRLPRARPRRALVDLRRHRPARPRGRVLVRLDGEPDRRGGRPAPHGSRDRDQHDHAPDRGVDRRAGRGKHRRRPHSRGDGAARGVRIHRRVRDVGRRGGRGLRARVLDPWPPQPAAVAARPVSETPT